MPLNQLEQRQRKPSFFHALSYRIPLPVLEVVVFRGGDGYSVCPRCDSLFTEMFDILLLSHFQHLSATSLSDWTPLWLRLCHVLTMAFLRLSAYALFGLFFRISNLP